MMKYLIITVLTILFFAACNSQHSATRTEETDDNNKKIKVEDDGKTMHIKVKIDNVENDVDYDKEFNVSHMSEQQKQTLKDHILDSLYKIK
ncbi:MAG: hypothetical protein ABIN94_23000 [Ferruginibacter sp.]